MPITPGEATLTSTFGSDAGSVTAVARLDIAGANDAGLTLVDYIDVGLASDRYQEV